MNFAKKITDARPYMSPSANKQQSQEIVPLTRFESDRGRIINSAAVRRLQQKTQVFPLERNSAVRSRLTHSLEVQQVGRFIVQTIFRNLTEQEQKEYGLLGLERHLESLVEMACLMHDIGNPPFGHFGEQAINDWFEKNLPSCYPQSESVSIQLNEELARDICHFEGNAQAIRLVHTLLNLNLTYTQVSGILKYTRCGTNTKPEKPHPQHYLQKKVGYYFSETGYVNDLRKALDMEEGCRHPVSYIMEAADDISYCIADLEDAIEKHILDLDKLQSALTEEFEALIDEYQLSQTVPKALDLREILRKSNQAKEKDNICPSSQFFIAFRVGVIHPLVKHAADKFKAHINEVYNGTFNAALLEDKSYAHAITESLKSVAFKFAFCHQEVEAMELRGYKVITGLLDAYQPLLKLDRHTFDSVAKQEKQAPLLEKRLYKKLSSKHLRAYKQAVADKSDELEFYYRCRLLQDYISGMTDQFAYDEYRALMVAD